MKNAGGISKGGKFHIIVFGRCVPVYTFVIYIIVILIIEALELDNSVFAVWEAIPFIVITIGKMLRVIITTEIKNDIIPSGIIQIKSYSVTA